MTNKRPSVLVLLADQLRGGELGCEGNPHAATPHIDRLASGGVVAEQCYANTPVCCPNRATLLSGRYPMNHGVVGNDLPVPDEVVFMSEEFQRAGYRTGYIGKWHLDGVPRSKFTPPGPRRHGFDYWAAANCTHEYFSTKYYFMDDPELVRKEGYEPEIQTDLALDFLQSLDASEDFMMVLSWGPPHDPYDQVPDEYRDRIDVAALENRENSAHPLGEQRAAEIYRDYLAALAGLDDQVGRIVEKLSSLGRLDDTIIVFTSDHGDMLGSHGWTGKQMPHEESIRIPLITAWPNGLPAGERRSGLLSTVDTAPTLLSLSNLPALDGVDGSDRSVLLREDGNGATEIYVQNLTRFDEAVRSGKPEWRGLRTEQWTYAESTTEGPWLLFDNLSDPLQTTNLIDSDHHQQTRESLKATLAGYLEKTADPFVSTPEMIEHLGLAEKWAARELELSKGEWK